jgi:hypothetical protein
MYRTLFELMLLLLVAATVLAAPAPPPASNQDLHSGPVMAVMSDAIMIMDERDNSVETIAVTPQTKITLNGDSASLVDLQMGDQATVTANPSDEKLTAITISAMRRL